jgi:uncharacterized protein GlcG (DUF336 family)
MPLTLHDARRMVDAAMAKAEEMNIKLSVAVCDSGGHLLAFNRNEGCIWIAAQAAQGKAVAATGMGRPSGEINADSPVMQVILASQGGRMVPAQGAVPIIRDGDIVGAIGGSGGTAQQDEDCAKAGLAVL